METGNLIRALRVGAGLTQKQLGDLCGMADSAIRRYESGRGNPTEKTLQRIADALRVPVEALLSKESEIQHYAELDDMYYRGVIRWSEDSSFSADESAALKMHFAEFMLRYKKMVEAIASCKAENSQLFDSEEMLIRNANAPLSSREILEFHLAQTIEKELSNLKSWIDTAPMYFSSAVFKNIKAAPGAANTESGKDDTDH